MNKIALGLAAAIALSGCTPDPVAVTSVPVTASMKRRLDTSKLAKDTTKTTVRAYTVSADGKKTNEVVGAKC
ncbi:hypothetical protein [Litorivita sp. NS0012-18]|uniref:hypothetical protein n=1 Tax=Litorivita sp. NS0012-18 TaxID=3127655 RepID=UPI00333EAD97